MQPTATAERDVSRRLAHPATGERVAPRPGLFDGVVWRDAAGLWLATRILFFALVYVGRALLGERIANLGDLYIPWTAWDGAIYGDIGAHGYTQPWQAAFFPLYPAVEHALALLTGLSATAAGPLISNAACLGVFVVLRVLIEREAGRATARRALLALALFPTAMYLASAYTEALFLLLSLAAFLALRQRRWLVAGVLAALATLTRPVGILLIVALGAEALVVARQCAWKLDRRELARIAGAVALPIAALLGFELYLAHRFGTLNATAGAETNGWGRVISWPWDGLTRAGSALLHDDALARIHAGLDIAFLLIFVALALATLRWLPLPYALYSCASLALVLVTPTHTYNWYALASDGRYLLSVFPVFWLLGRWGERPWAARVMTVVSVGFLILLLLAFSTGAWVE